MASIFGLWEHLGKTHTCKLHKKGSRRVWKNSFAAQNNAGKWKKEKEKLFWQPIALSKFPSLVILRMEKKLLQILVIFFVNFFGFRVSLMVITETQVTASEQGLVSNRIFIQ